MLSPGDRVKDYEVIAPLRSGGMAMLYLARRRGVGGFSRLVALKLVHSHLLEHDGINRLFLEEARIAANIAHPNVVNVEEVGRCGGNYFIAMEYVHGVSLGELLGSLVDRRLRMSPKLCVWLAAQVAEALHAAHEATGENGAPMQIVHRDVSPQNILISHTGHIKLIDFGIADSHHTSEHSVPTGGAVLGKLGYMAPEQLRMQVADRRSDVYALGVTLWEMLTSRNLFRCQRIDDERDWATREDPPPPSRYSAIAMPALDRVVLKAIACDPNARFESALAFRSALLRAAPAAAQVDAPMFAALMHTMLGAELERRSANWPSDVSRELHLDEIENTPALNLGELTADMGGSSGEVRTPFDAADEEDPTTVAEAPSALRSGRPGAPGAEHAAAYGSAAPSTPEAHIDTVAVPPSTARPPANRSARALSLAGLSLVLGMVLGSLSSGSPPSEALGSVLETPARAAPATPPSRKSTFTVLSELTVNSAPAAAIRVPAPAEPPEPPTREAPPSALPSEPLLPDSDQALTSTTDAEQPLPAAGHALVRATGKREAGVQRAGPERRAPLHARGGKRGAMGVRKGAALRPARAKLGGAGNRKNKSTPRPRTAVADPNAPW